MRAATAINMVSNFFSRPYVGERKFLVLVINRVRVFASRLHTPTQFLLECPPQLPGYCRVGQGEMSRHGMVATVA